MITIENELNEFIKKILDNSKIYIVVQFDKEDIKIIKMKKPRVRCDISDSNTFVLYNKKREFIITGVDAIANPKSTDIKYHLFFKKVDAIEYMIKEMKKDAKENQEPVV